MAEKSSRFQVYVPNPRLTTALEKEAKAAKVSLSQAACRLMERGLKKTISTDPADQLAVLTRMFHDHRRATTQDLMLLQEMVAVLLREFYVRLPGTPEDADALLQAAGEAKLEEVYADAAERIVRGERRLDSKRPQAEPDTAPDPPPPRKLVPEPAE